MKTLTYDSKQFDAVICLNSDLPDKVFFELLPDIPILAADGAALRLLEIGIVPDYIIGDLDSFDLKPSLPAGRVWVGSDFASLSGKEWRGLAGTKIIKIPEQDTNDFEKILKWSKENSLTNLLILGFHGGELEHTLNNWSVLMKYSQLLNLCIFDKNRYGIPIYQSITFNCRIGEIISIIPYQSVKLSTKNLEWELKSEELVFGVREGARNRAISDNIELEILSGACLLFIDSKIPFCPKYDE